MTNERLNEITDSLLEKLDDTNKGLIADDIASLIAENSATENTLNEKNTELEKIRKNNENLLKVNGNLMQRVRMENEPDEAKKQFEREEKDIKEITFIDLFDNKRKI